MEQSTTSLTGESDILEHIADRYKKSRSPHHRQLYAAAAYTQCMIKSKSLPVTPLNYFVNIIDALYDSSYSHTLSNSTFNADAMSGMSSFLTFVLTMVPEKSISMSKAAEAVEIVVKCLEVEFVSLRVLRFMECLRVLLEICDLGDWDIVKLSFQTFIKYAVDNKNEKVRKCAEHCVLKALHMLDLLKRFIPFLTKPEDMQEVILELQKCMTAKFSTLYVLDVMEEILALIESESELIFVKTVKISDKWKSDYSILIQSITGLLICEATAARASNILKEMFSRVLFSEVGLNAESEQSNLVRCLCDSLLEVLRTYPNEHSLSVISALFLHLGLDSFIYMDRIFMKTVGFMSDASTCDVKHFEQCIGSAVMVMGPDKIHTLYPLSFDANEQTCSNTWLLPIYKEYVIYSHVRFFIRTIVPLSESFRKACKRGKKMAVKRKQMQSLSRTCWELLPSFCRYPYDLEESFGSLAEILIPNIKENASMLESIAIALQCLVKQNMSLSLSFPGSSGVIDMGIEKENAERNIKVMASWSEALLKAFTNVFFQVSPEKRSFLKETIGCLANIAEFPTSKAIFISSLERVKPDVSDQKNANIGLIHELASAIVADVGMDPIDFIYCCIGDCLKEDDEEAYANLYILLESFEFMSSRFEQLVDLLRDLKSPVDIISFRWRFLCLKTLLFHSFERTCDGENKYGVWVLNEIIVTLKDDKEDRREVAHDILLDTSSIMQSKPETYYKFITMMMGYLFGFSPCITSGAILALSIMLSNDSKICELKPDLVPEILELLDREEDIQVAEAVLWFLKMLVLSLEVAELKMVLCDILNGLQSWSFVSDLPEILLLERGDFRNVFEICTTSLEEGKETSRSPQHDFKANVNEIFENIVQKCGSASVESLVPEKYRLGFRICLESAPSSPEEGKANEALITSMFVSSQEEGFCCRQQLGT
ncbi:unnamed protein product [Lactuca saligna]|uniref:Ribosomal RNA-processing protein 12-like conserved domain-containing protein n=1 Tax=Lactuca saligna TaxID=75948 RepID=A0AA36EM99_LACSI|nr:unnamed protein product [Lactuca saligna]